MLKATGLFCVIAAVAGVFGGHVFADSVTESTVFADQSLDWGPVAPIPSIHQFNPSLGTLDSIDLTLSAQLNAAIQIANWGSDAASTTMDLTAQINLLTPEGNTLSAPLEITRTYFLQPADPGNLFADPNAVSESGLHSSNSATLHLTSPTDLAYYIGTGTLALFGNTNDPASRSHVSEGNGNVLFSVMTTGGGTATIQYNYTPAVVPLPSAASGGLVLLSGLVTWRKLRSRSSSSADSQSAV